MNGRSECFSIAQPLEPGPLVKVPYNFKNPYPYLVCNIGSGVSIMAVFSPQEYRRVSGNLWLTRTLWNISHLPIFRCDHFSCTWVVSCSGNIELTRPAQKFNCIDTLMEQSCYMSCFGLCRNRHSLILIFAVCDCWLVMVIISRASIALMRK